LNRLVNLYVDPPCLTKDADDFPATMGQLRNSTSELIQPPREAVYFLRAVAALKICLADQALQPAFEIPALARDLAAAALDWKIWVIDSSMDDLASARISRGVGRMTPRT
jgi:hypothetical protein